VCAGVQVRVEEQEEEGEAAVRQLEGKSTGGKSTEGEHSGRKEH
jgi:hypothetical protein